MKFVNNLRTSQKLIYGFGIMVLLMLLIAVLGLKGTMDVHADLETMYNHELQIIERTGTVHASIRQITTNIYNYIVVPEKAGSILTDFNAQVEIIDSQLTFLQDHTLSSDEASMINSFSSNWDEYKAAAIEVMSFLAYRDTPSAITSLSEGGRMHSARIDLESDLTGMLEGTRNQADKEYSDATEKSNLTRTVIFFGFAGSLALAILIIIVLSHSINTPIKLLINALHTLMVGSTGFVVEEKARKELLTRKDDFGDLSRAVVSTRRYFAEMAEVAAAIASNDLSVKVQPKSEDDTLGNTLQQMVKNLNATLADFLAASSQVQQTSSQLAEASRQSGQVTEQISQTIQQVATGISQQAEAINRTASSIDEMGRVIDGVAKGAEDQAEAATKAFSLTNQLSDAIQKVAGNIDHVVSSSIDAEEAAQRGYQTVNQTLSGMQAIKNAVDLSSKKVQEMGSRSDQIGNIVTTIEDIASQTNLLALNAAIEAARAGDAGKGFAVVADEVRKLAERSSSSTKEIADLVSHIQQTVDEAVEAMTKGAKEVDEGVDLAKESGNALQEILTSNHTVNEQAKEAANAASNMATTASELIESVDSVSAVVEQNKAATEEMAASSSEVMQAVENIASVSEENSAAVEEVSASAEEMNAQTEEVSASAQELAALAIQLEGIVKQFRLA